MGGKLVRRRVALTAGPARAKYAPPARQRISGVHYLCLNIPLFAAEVRRVTLNRAHARRIGFGLVVLTGVWFELSPWGARAAASVLDLQLLALDHWSPHAPAGDAAATKVGPGTTTPRPEFRPLSPVVAMSLVVIAALVWWESRLLGWAIASSLVALAALIAVSTMMLPRGVLVPTAGPGLAIVAGVLGRRALEAVIAARDRRGRRPRP